MRLLAAAIAISAPAATSARAQGELSKIEADLKRMTDARGAVTAFVDRGEGPDVRWTKVE